MTNEALELYACKPGPTGRTVHLHAPGYRPGKKTRSIGDSASLCGVLASPHRTPLKEALEWPCPAPATLLTPPQQWEWCRSCVGHAAASAGLSRHVLELITGSVVSGT